MNVKLKSESKQLVARGGEKDEEVQISTEYNEFQILLHYILHNYMFYCFYPFLHLPKKTLTMLSG